MSYTPTISVADIDATGSKSATTFLRGDASWAVPAGGTPYTGTIAKVMTADQSTASNTTLTNVTDLVFAIGASETWVYHFVIPAGVGIGITGAKIAATLPAGATGWIDVLYSESPYSSIGGENSNAHVFNATSSTGVDFDTITPRVLANDGTFRVALSVVNSTTAGNVQLQFAQSTSDVTNLTFKAKSFGVGTKCS